MTQSAIEIAIKICTNLARNYLDHLYRSGALPSDWDAEEKAINLLNNIHAINMAEVVEEEVNRIIDDQDSFEILKYDEFKHDIYKWDETDLLPKWKPVWEEK